MSYRAEHHELQGILAKELPEYGPLPLSAKDADDVAWHLADVTMQVIISAVERARAEGMANLTGRLDRVEKSTSEAHRGGVGSAPSGRAAQGPAGGRTPGGEEPAKSRAQPGSLDLIEVESANHLRRSMWRSSEGWVIGVWIGRTRCVDPCGLPGVGRGMVMQDPHPRNECAPALG
jgi:hypothetical protein